MENGKMLIVLSVFLFLCVIGYFVNSYIRKINKTQTAIEQQINPNYIDQNNLEDPNQKVSYLVTYGYDNGFGNANIVLSKGKKDINSFSDIIEIEKLIAKEKGYEKVSVLFYSKLE